MSEKTAQVSDETRSLGLVVARGTSEQPSVHDVSCLFKLGFGELVVTWSGRCQNGRLQLTPDGFCLKALATLFVRHVDLPPWSTLIHLVLTCPLHRTGTCWAQCDSSGHAHLSCRWHGGDRQSFCKCLGDSAEQQSNKCSELKRLNNFKQR